MPRPMDGPWTMGEPKTRSSCSVSERHFRSGLILVFFLFAGILEGCAGAGDFVA